MNGPPVQPTKLFRSRFHDTLVVREPRKYRPTRGPLGALFFCGIARNPMMKHLSGCPREFFSLEVKNTREKAIVAGTGRRRHTTAHWAKFESGANACAPRCLSLPAVSFASNRGSLRVGRMSYEEPRSRLALECPRPVRSMLHLGRAFIVGETEMLRESPTRANAGSWKFVGEGEMNCENCHRGAVNPGSPTAGGLESPALVNTCGIARTARRCYESSLALRAGPA